jgi:hypothetical protein
MSKVIDLNKSVASLCDEYPELIDILAGLGLTPLKNPVMRKTMTLLNASKKRRIPMEMIYSSLESHDFLVNEGAK